MTDGEGGRLACSCASSEWHTHTTGYRYRPWCRATSHIVKLRLETEAGRYRLLVWLSTGSNCVHVGNGMKTSPADDLGSWASAWYESSPERISREGGRDNPVRTRIWIRKYSGKSRGVLVASCVSQLSKSLDAQSDTMVLCGILDTQGSVSYGWVRDCQ